jgi:hypothetical protein
MLLLYNKVHEIVGLYQIVKVRIIHIYINHGLALMFFYKKVSTTMTYNTLKLLEHSMILYLFI